MHLSFFSGPDCCLCDQAKALIEPLIKERDLRIDYVNIKGNAEYMHRYGARIPVIMRNDTKAEIEWPFDIQQLVAFVNE